MAVENTAIRRSQRGDMQTLAKLIESKKSAFALVAGKHFSPDRLVKLAQGALARTPDLANCTPGSILVALMRCAELDLEPDSALPQRRMWLVPRWNNKLGAKECTFVIDYRAQIQKARESGLVRSVVASEVRRNDRFAIRYDPEGNSILKFDFAPGADGGPFADRGDVVGYFSAARIEGGEVQIAAMSVREAEAFRDRRAPKKKDGSLQQSPWVSDFDAMAIKSCLRKLWNLLPAGSSTAAQALQRQIASEETIEVGASVTSTAPELDLGIGAGDEEPPKTRTEQVKAKLAPKAEEPPPANDEPPPGFESEEPADEPPPEEGEIRAPVEESPRQVFEPAAEDEIVAWARAHPDAKASDVIRQFKCSLNRAVAAVNAARS